MTAAPAFSAADSLAELATRHPGASRVFHRHGLDFCCHGRRSLAEACAPDGLDVDALIEELITEERAAPPATRWDERPLDELMDHILAHYHEAHRAELPRLLEMAQKVERVHGDKPECPAGLARHLANVAASMEDHMQKEEQVLFPAFRGGQGPLAGMPVRCMEQEHEEHARNLERTRALAHDFVPPEGACATWRALYLGLEQLEQDLMDHVHLENHVLFPRALRA